MNAAMKFVTRVTRFAVGLALGPLLPVSLALAQVPNAPPKPKVGPNVNMVSGTRFPEGDPFLTKQNEPSIAVSSRNPRHLLAASNDYRQVAVMDAEGLKGGKAWNTLYKSIDGGTTWRSVVLGGCPLNIDACKDDFTGIAGTNGLPIEGTGLTSGLRALAPAFSADPTVRAGPYGTFFYTFIAGRNDGSADGVVAIQRFVDKNNDIQRETDVRYLDAQPPSTERVPVLRSAEDPILPDKMTLLDRGTSGQFIDKPWNAADVGGRAWNTGTCELLSWTKGRTDLKPAAETVPAFSVYVSYALFPGQGSNDHPNVYVAASSDCGNTFSKPVKISNSLDATSGTSMAIDPLTGTVYVVWRRFGSLESPPKPDQIYMNKSSDGGRTWLNQPAVVEANLIPYDQPATGGSFRTLAFPSVAVSVDSQGTSRLHVAYTSRSARADVVPPYTCLEPTGSTPKGKACDTRVRIKTLNLTTGVWSAAKEVDSIPSSPTNLDGRGHQFQPALTFAAGKLAITWLDQRFDHTEEIRTCPAGGGACTSRREAKGNLVQGCSVDTSGPDFDDVRNDPDPNVRGVLGLLAGCWEYSPGRPASVWTTYLNDRTPGLVRRHTLDVFAALAAPADLPSFVSAPVSEYLFGSTEQDSRAAVDIRQKEVFAPNLPLFVGGTAAFIGDYIDMAGQSIVASDVAANGAKCEPAAAGNPNQCLYKFNVGTTSCSSDSCTKFTTGGTSPVFHVAFTDNRDVIPPRDGNWSTPTCLATSFTGDPANPTTNFGTQCLDKDGNPISRQPPGFAGNRNQNVRSAIVAADAVAYAYSNSKRLNGESPRGFVITVDNYEYKKEGETFRMKVTPPDGVTASFDKFQADVLQVDVLVQPRSSSTRSLWLKAANPAARVSVEIWRCKIAGGCITTPPTPPATIDQFDLVGVVPLNPDPGANDSLVGNGDGPGVADTSNNDMDSVVLSNMALTNNVLSDSVQAASPGDESDTLRAKALSNLALTNAALSNVVLSNRALSNLQIEELDPGSPNAEALALSNKVLSNVVLTNAVLSNGGLDAAALSNLALSNLALTNLDPANLALSNAVLSNNALSNVALTNRALSNDGLDNAVLTNAVLTNAVLSNLALSNKALSNAALSNGVLSNLALSNLALSNKVLSNLALSNNPLDGTDALSAVEAANFDLNKNQFTTAALQQPGSTFADATFSVRNRGNTDTTLAIKLLLDTAPGEPAPPTLQLVMRKVVLVPTAIPPTGPALQADSVGTARGLRIGLTQFNAQVSNIGTPEVINVNDPNLGKFQPGKADAATLPLAPGERAYVTLRALCNPQQTDCADPFDFLRWGSKLVVVDAAQTTRTAIPLIIKTLSLSPTTALTPTAYQIRTAGGFGSVTGSAICSDRLGVPTNVPCLGLAASTTLTFTVLPAGPSNTSRDAVVTLSVTPGVKGRFYLLIRVADGSVPPQEDQQLLEVVVDGAAQTVSPALETLLPSALEYGKTFVLRPASTSSDNPVVYSASGACSVTGPVAREYTLMPDQVSPPDCVIVARVDGNDVYATLTATRALTVAKGSQTITFDALPDRVFGTPSFAVTATASSGLTVSLSSLSMGVCTISGNTVTLVTTGTCSIAADQTGDDKYTAASQVTRSFNVLAPSSQFVPVGAMVQARRDHTATLLRDGRVLLAGGLNASGAPTDTSEIYTPATGTLTGTFASAGNLPSKAAGHTATLLNDGRVFVAGGGNSSTVIFTPRSGTTLDTWSPSGGMSSTRSYHTATLLPLPDGRVLLAGGADNAGKTIQSTILFNPATGSFSNGPLMTAARERHTATLLTSGPFIGEVLITGGRQKAGAGFTVLRSAERCSATACTAVGNLSTARYGHAAAQLGGKVLLVGGAEPAAASADLYDGTTFTSVVTRAPRRDAAVAELADGRVLITGGIALGVVLKTSETSGSPFLVGPPMTAPHAGHRATRLVDGRVLVTGGAGATGAATAAAEVFVVGGAVGP